jgi:hypothetical protein
MGIRPPDAVERLGERDTCRKTRAISAIDRQGHPPVEPTAAIVLEP